MLNIRRSQVGTWMRIKAKNFFSRGFMIKIPEDKYDIETYLLMMRGLYITWNCSPGSASLLSQVEICLVVVCRLC